MAAAKHVYSEDVKFPLADDWYASVFRCDNYVNMSLCKWKTGYIGTMYVDKSQANIQLIRPQFMKFFAVSDDIINAIDTSSAEEMKFDLSFNLLLMIKPGSHYGEGTVVIENTLFKRLTTLPTQVIRKLVQSRDAIVKEVQKMSVSLIEGSKKRKVSF